MVQEEHPLVLINHYHCVRYLVFLESLLLTETFGHRNCLFFFIYKIFYWVSICASLAEKYFFVETRIILAYELMPIYHNYYSVWIFLVGVMILPQELYLAHGSSIGLEPQETVLELSNDVTIFQESWELARLVAIVKELVALRIWQVNRSLLIQVVILVVWIVVRKYFDYLTLTFHLDGSADHVEAEVWFNIFSQILHF